MLQEKQLRKFIHETINKSIFETNDSQLDADNIKLIFTKGGKIFKLLLNKFGYNKLSDMPDDKKDKFFKYFYVACLLAIKTIKTIKTETTNTESVEGYETPFAFVGKGSNYNKKNKKNLYGGYALFNTSDSDHDGDDSGGDVGALSEAKYTPAFDNMEDYIEYLKDTLIPDLLRSGMDETASDFREAIYWLIGASYKHSFNSKKDYIEYLEDTLIPDLIDNKDDETVTDFREAIYWLTQPKKINESIDSFYLKDDSLTPEQKLVLSIRQIRNNLSDIEKLVNKSISLKNESNIDSSKLGKRAYQALRRINEKTVKLMVLFNNLK